MKQILVLMLVCVIALPAITPVAAWQDASACGTPATPIHDIQGSEDTSPMISDKVAIEGVVVGDYQNMQFQLGGFMMQEEDDQIDDSAATSEGIFVLDNNFGVDVNPGDVVRVEGTVMEQNDSGVSTTILRRVQTLTICGTGISVTPAAVETPFNALESYEGMLITFPQELIVNDLYNMGRYGEITLSAGARMTVPTQIAAPGDPAAAVQADNAARQILIDDGDSQQNRDPIVYPTTVRAGDTVTGLTGVVDQRLGVYRVYPTIPVQFTSVNPRPTEPPAIPGTVRVVSYNLLNYFNGDGTGEGYPTARGASTPTEFERQRSKIINAIVSLNPAVMGVMEMENDGSGPNSAMADLVNGLNAAAGSDLYAYVPDPANYPAPGEPGVGGDEIKNAILYQPGLVTPVGDPIADYDPIHNRPPIAQTFEVNATGERFTVVAVHFKSKGCTDARGDDGDQNDGQGCYNAARVQQAQQLLDFLAELEQSSGDPDILIVGDFNSYPMEDPIQVLVRAGYVDLLAQFGGPSSYSYVYFGQMGHLDYGFASPSLAEQVAGADVWHINADEPRIFDYNEEYKSEAQVADFYSPDPFRTGDHDPVIIGIN
jgi:predicted extracellular nuclease